MADMNNPYDEMSSLYDDAYIDASGRAGQESDFAVPDPDDPSKNLSQRTKRCRLVKNTTASTLAAGECCKAVTTTPTTFASHVDQAGSGDAPVGLVNDMVGSAGVATLKWFWMCISGPNDFMSSGTIAAGVELKTAASGELQASAASDHSDVGMAMEASVDTETKLCNVKLG